MGNHSQVSKFPARSLFRQNQHPGSPENWPLSCNGGIELSKWLHLKKRRRRRACSHSGKNKSSTLCSGNFQVTAHFSAGIKEKINTFARQTINPSQHFGGSCWQPALWLFNWWPQPGWVGVQCQLWEYKTAIPWLSVGCCREPLSWPLWKILGVGVGTACTFCSWVAVVLVSATVIVSSSHNSNVLLVGTTVWTVPILRD